MSKKAIIDEMFSSKSTTTVGNRSLAGTVQLTSLANELAAKCIKKLNADLETYRDKFTESKASHDAMDELIALLIDFDKVDIEFIKQLDEKTVDGMLKSQQSKRSRAKSKEMTLDNYKSMLSGAIAENLIRRATGKTKNSSGSRRAAGAIGYSAEELTALENDQAKLRKEIRNIQSKKSIMKSKADFDENSERWQNLLAVEDQLKRLRVGHVETVYVSSNETVRAIEEALGTLDIEQLEGSDHKTLLAKILNIVNHTNEATEDEQADEQL